ncbi:MAG: hypothetical protein QOH63_2970 [Acidobacteriota bacterium]|jgi:hypothetical protein|nr:hypothetical protein [Acidobacteriota bacterium]
MISLHINPPGVEEEYLKCLNLCFGGWGDLRKYDWYFRRNTPYPDADLLTFKRDDELVAGSAVTYRKVALPNDCEIIVGIMTGAWTLPQFRNQGYFARLIEESLQLTARKGGALLLGFAVEERSSFRQLARAGSALFPGSYIFSTPRTEAHNSKSRLTRVKKSGPVISRLQEWLRASNKGYSRFVYASEQDFYSQFIDRPGDTEILTDDHGNFGIIERTADTNLLQLCLTAPDETYPALLIEALIKDALGNGRKLFLYSTQSGINHLARGLGLEVKTGYVTVLISDESRLSEALKLGATSKIEDTSVLAQADSQWFLGNWNIQSGDRA